jgi:hypothetical protein
LSGFAHAANDHIDADGLLALAAACAPHQALPHAALLIGAAEAGDFCDWPGEPAFRLMVRLHQLIRDARAHGQGWEQRACDAAVDGLETLIAESGRPDGERDRQVARVLAARRALASGDGFTVLARGNLIAAAWTRRLGHPCDSFMAIDIEDDLPPWAWSAVADQRQFQLSAMGTGTGTGTLYQLDAPRFSWARMVQRPTIPWPDLAPVAAELQRRETGPCRWVAGAEARKMGFVCQLIGVDQAGPAASRLPIEVVMAEVAKSLALA